MIYSLEQFNRGSEVMLAILKDDTELGWKRTIGTLIFQQSEEGELKGWKVELETLIAKMNKLEL